jgi:hypothetical protein
MTVTPQMTMTPVATPWPMIPPAAARHGKLARRRTKRDMAAAATAATKGEEFRDFLFFFSSFS